jgi:predicted small secreted protein
MAVLAPSAAPRFRRWSMKKLMLMLALSGGLVLSACNTVEGAGRDVQSVGNAIEDTAD